MVRQIGPCGHIFHSHCLMQWLAVKQECPLCKTDLRSRSLKNFAVQAGLVEEADLSVSSEEPEEEFDEIANELDLGDNFAFNIPELPDFAGIPGLELTRIPGLAPIRELPMEGDGSIGSIEVSPAHSFELPDPIELPDLPDIPQLPPFGGSYLSYTSEDEDEDLELPVHHECRLSYLEQAEREAQRIEGRFESILEPVIEVDEDEECKQAEEAEPVQPQQEVFLASLGDEMDGKDLNMYLNELSDHIEMLENELRYRDLLDDGEEQERIMEEIDRTREKLVEIFRKKFSP